MAKSVWEVSYELESILEKCFNTEFNHTGTIFDREIIEKDMFYEVIHLLLQMYGGEGSYDFLNKYLWCKRVSMNDISNYQEIFEEFKTLFKYCENNK